LSNIRIVTTHWDFASSGVVPRHRVAKQGRTPFNKESDSKIQMLLKGLTPSIAKELDPKNAEFNIPRNCIRIF
jgi:hypothetical protein